MSETVQLDNLTVAFYEPQGRLGLVAGAVNLRLLAASGPPEAVPMACGLEGLSVSELRLEEGPRLVFDVPVASVNDFFLALHGYSGRRQADKEPLTRDELMRLHATGLTASRGMRVVFYKDDRGDDLVEVLDFHSVALAVVGVRMDNDKVHSTRVRSIRLKGEAHSDPLQPWGELVGHAGVRRLVLREEMASQVIPTVY